MKTFSLPLCLCLYVALQLFALSYARAQNWQSGIKATGSGQSESMYQDADIVVDGAGNMVISGSFKNTLTFGDFTIQADGDSYADIFICRIGANQQVQWLKQVSGGFSYGDNIALSLDDDNNIYITGSLDGKIFVAKYDASGTVLWTRTFGNDVWGYGTAVKTDIYDNVYISGGDGWNFFMAKVDPDGDVVWIKDIWVNYSAGCLISDIAVDVLGNIYFAGKFEIDLPLDHITLDYTGSWGPNVFWGKMNTNGKVLWAKSATGRSTEKVNLELTGNSDLVLSGGVAGSTVTFDGKSVLRSNCCSGASGFIVKGDTAGAVVWAKPATSEYEGSVPVDMQTDRAGNIYMTGIFFTCYGTFCTENDFYVEKYDNAGVPQWRTNFASGGTEFSKAIDIDNNGLLYLLGINSSPTFIDETAWIDRRTFGIGLFNTGSTTYKRTPRPTVARETWICEPGNSAELTASGNLLQWYGSPRLTPKLADGSYTYVPVNPDTVYVTQTVNGVESWPTPAVVRFASIPVSDLIAVADSIIAPEEGSDLSYQWYRGGTLLTGENNSYILVTPGDYANYSVVISQGTCEETLTSIITSIVPEFSHDLAVYPNPAKDHVSITDMGGISSVRVLDINGREVISHSFLQSSYVRIDLGPQPNGMFLIEVTAKGVRRYAKVLKR